MIRLLQALLVSICIHALLAAALAVCLGRIPLQELPRLDLSAVELSFAEEPSPKAVPAPEPSAPPEAHESEPEPVPELDQAPESEPEPEPEPEELAGPSDSPEPDPALPPAHLAEAEPHPSESPPPPPPAPAPRQARIDAHPSPVKPIRPVYPKGARQRREEGDVVLLLSIDANGRVTSASVADSSGYPELDDAALRAAKKARFAPARSGRSAVAAEARMTIEFRLK